MPKKKLDYDSIKSDFMASEYVEVKGFMISNGYPYNSVTEYNTNMIGIMFAGRNAEDTGDDLVFYCMNSYWEPLTLQLPN